VRTGSLIVSIARLLEEEEPFPVTLLPDARVTDGEAHLLLRCPAATYSGTLVLERRVNGRRRPAGRVRFTCDPPSEPVSATLTPAVRRRLGERGRVRLTVRISISGLAREGAARLTLRSA
jgi:hypothetical protein